MTYLVITDALNDGIKKLLNVLPAATLAKINFVESQDIAVTLNSLAKICMIACVKDASAAEDLEEAYKNESLTDANAAAKFMEAFIALHNKANPSNAVPDEPDDDEP